MSVGRPALIVALILAGRVAQAQVPFNACVDREDRPIVGVVDNALPYDGVATIRMDGTPVIFYNQKSLTQTTQEVKHFVYLHECGHHALRHVWKDPSRVREMEADCWAIQYLVEHGYVKRRHIDRLQSEIGTSRGIGNLKNCVDVKTDQELWRKSLDLLTLAGAHKFAPIRGEAIPEDPERGFFESTLDLPGTFNCELTPEGSFTCEIFSGKDQGAADDHFERVLPIIHRWLTEEWLTFERTRARPSEVRRFVAQDIQTGALLTLVMTDDHRIIFRYQPAL
jgi:hypothetical protein